jgi:two-component system, cell cycle sensor histidine kinase and response regulator CckA
MGVAPDSRPSESEARLRLALDLARLAVTELDVRTGRLTHAGHVREVLGFDPDHLPATFDAALRFVHPDDVAMLRERTSATLHHGAPFDLEFRIRFPDGAWNWVSWQAQRVADRQGRALKIIAIGRNTTLRRSRMERLAEQSALLRAVVDNVPISIYTKDREGRYGIDNAAHLRRLGVQSEAEVRGRTVFDFFPEEIAAAFAADDRAVIDSGQPILDREEPFVDPPTGRRRWYRTTKVPLVDATGAVTGLVGLSLDVTDAKLLEQQLLQSQKMEMMGRLAGGVAHDFNNLLTVILGSLELLRLDGGVVGDQIDNIQLAATHAAHLTRQLLTFSRQQVIDPRVLDLNVLIAEARTMLMRLISETIVLDTRPASGLWPVRVDPGQTMQVLVNLVVNARDAMPNGGRLTIATGNVTLTAEDLARQPKAAPGDYVCISVSDTGVGLTEDVKQHLFEAFFTTKEKGRGTGLGLATSYGIVRQSDGFITADNQPGGGARFTVFLPRAGEILDATARPAPAMDPAIEPGRETVLVVEDNELVREIAVEALVRHGYAVVAARDAEEALAVARDLPHAVDLLLTDVVLPTMDGRELAARFCAENRNARVLFVSGYAAETIVIDEMAPDFFLLQKPYTTSTLVRRVQEVLSAAPAGLA